jgi:hypothetical protein
MTSAQMLIGSLIGSGITLSLDGANIRLRGPRGSIGPTVMANIRLHKADIITELQQQTTVSAAVRTVAARISTILDRFERPDQLAKFTRAFLVDVNFRDAVRLEWTDAQLFGISPHAPLIRVESWGLITGLVFSPHNRRDKQERHHMTRLISIDETGATIVTPGGSEFRFDRFHHGLAVSVPWWEVPGFYLPPPF